MENRHSGQKMFSKNEACTPIEIIRHGVQKMSTKNEACTPIKIISYEGEFFFSLSVVR